MELPDDNERFNDPKRTSLQGQNATNTTTTLVGKASQIFSATLRFLAETD